MLNSEIRLVLGLLWLLSQLLWTTLKFICLRFCHSYFPYRSFCSLVILPLSIFLTSIVMGLWEGKWYMYLFNQQKPPFHCNDILCFCSDILPCRTILCPIYWFDMMLTLKYSSLLSVHFHCQTLYKLYCFLDWEPKSITKSLVFILYFLSFTENRLSLDLVHFPSKHA